MNITMKKINILASLLLGGLLFSACDSDRDDNPTLVMPTGFELYAPADAENNTLDLLNSSTVDFTANQPDFGGFPVATTYTLQISLDSVFTDADEATGTTQNYADPSTTFTQPTMSVKASELNESMINLYETIKNTGSYDNAVRPLYVRCKANISTVKGSDVYSNVVELPNVLATYKARRNTAYRHVSLRQQHRYSLEDVAAHGSCLWCNRTVLYLNLCASRRCLQVGTQGGRLARCF